MEFNWYRVMHGITSFVAMSKYVRRRWPAHKEWWLWIVEFTGARSSADFCYCFANVCVRIIPLKWLIHYVHPFLVFCSIKFIVFHVSWPRLVSDICCQCAIHIRIDIQNEFLCDLMHTQYATFSAQNTKQNSAMSIIMQNSHLVCIHRMHGNWLG